MDILNRLKSHAQQVKGTHLKDLLSSPDKPAPVSLKHLLFDYSHSKITQQTLSLLNELSSQRSLYEKINNMFSGQTINTTQNRQVLHILLRAQNSSLESELSQVNRVRNNIKEFANSVRSGEIKGVSGKPFRNILCIGIGGSYLGPEFVAEALRTDPQCAQASKNRRLRFLANVDPIDFLRATQDLDPQQTLVIVISKTFTTLQTIMNAQRARDWLLNNIQGYPPEQVKAAHLSAVSTNLQKTAEFGINQTKVFGFWDWVGGRFSVTSAVGLLPLYLQYGIQTIDQFLAGAEFIDQHFLENATPELFSQNIPIMLGLIGFWNTEFLGYSSRAILPYCQALLKFPAHIQQLDMESNGKQCKINGEPLQNSGPIVFGEPGTNGQHSFYQLMHQGRVVPAEFIGFCQGHSQDKQAHKVLMSNFFAQPKALALGRTPGEDTPSQLVPHKTFAGDRPSLSLLFKKLDAFSVGSLLAIYQHRIAVEGFLWELNSFDQFGVELGKGLALQVLEDMKNQNFEGNPLLEYFVGNSQLIDES